MEARDDRQPMIDQRDEGAKALTRPPESVEPDIDTMARRVAHDLFDWIAWDDYPDIGEHDFEAIAERVTELVECPPVSESEAAYKRLSDRATLTQEGLE